MSYLFDIKLKAIKMYLEEGIGRTSIATKVKVEVKFKKSY